MFYVVTLHENLVNNNENEKSSMKSFLCCPLVFASHDNHDTPNVSSGKIKIIRPKGN